MVCDKFMLQHIIVESLYVKSHIKYTVLRQLSVPGYEISRNALLARATSW